MVPFFSSCSLLARSSQNMQVKPRNPQNAGLQYTRPLDHLVLQKEKEDSCRVLDACLRFDGRRLAALLGYTVKREKTFGNGVPI